MEDGARGEVAEDLPRDVIELVGGEDAVELKVLAYLGIFRIEDTVPVFLGVLDGTVVLGTAHRAVEGDDSPLVEDLVDGIVVEVGSVIAL